jgi:pyruvate dehydrogenase E2 component (dihydrolipoamide acetyltransferase)
MMSGGGSQRRQVFRSSFIISHSQFARWTADMPIEFKLPDLGENIESGDIISVLVSEGDTIAAEQGVVEVETGKAVVELACPHAGRVAKVHVKKGDKVPIGATLLSIEPAAAEKAPPSKAPATSMPAAAPPEKPKPNPQPAARETPTAAPAKPTKAAVPQKAAPTKPAPEPVEVAATAAAPASQKESADEVAHPNGLPAAAAPATRRLARELGIELEQVQGSGPGGRITREDVTAAVRELATRPAPPPVESPSARRGAAPAAAPVEGEVEQDRWGTVRRVPLSAIRRTIAANMARSHSTVPHVTNFDDADITELERLRKGGMAELGEGIKLTTMAFLTKAVALSLKLHPAINVSSEDLEQGEMLYREYVSIGIAVDTPRGLVVPVLRNTDRMSIPQIARELASVADRARGGQLTIDDMRGGTFTISNLGAIGGVYSTPIINYPEVAILLLGRARQLPVVLGERIEPRLMCPLSLSYDHRWVDGAVAARFLNEVKGYLEAPARLLLAP